MARVVPHARETLDDAGHSRQGPQFRGEAMSPRPLEQGRFDLRDLRRLEPRLAPCTTRRLQGPAAFVLPGMKPVVSSGARHPQRAGDGHLRLAPCEQPRRFVPTRFQRPKIPTGSSAGRWHSLASQDTR